MLLDAGIDVGEGADGAGYGDGGDLFAGIFQAPAATIELGIGLGQLQAEGRRLGVNAMRATDRDRVLVLERALFQRLEKRVHVIEQDVGGTNQLDVEAGVEDVGRGHALMDEARVGPDEFRQMGQEGDDVVPRLALDLVDPLDAEGGRAAFLPDGLGRLLRNDAEIGQRIASMGLNLEPDAELRFLGPDGDHVGTRIARDHRQSLFKT